MTNDIGALCGYVRVFAAYANTCIVKDPYIIAKVRPYMYCLSRCRERSFETLFGKAGSGFPIYLR